MAHVHTPAHPAMAERKKYPDSIPVDPKLIAMIEEYDKLFDLTWDDDADPNDYIRELDEQGEEIVELIRRRMGLRGTRTFDPKRQAQRESPEPPVYEPREKIVHTQFGSYSKPRKANKTKPVEQARPAEEAKPVERE